MNIAVVGCGFAGMATALLLARNGHQVALFERIAAPQPIGAGILVQPIGQRILARLGLADEVRRQIAPIERLTGVTHSGRTMMNIAYGKWREDTTVEGWGTHRGVIYQALLNAVRAQPGITLHTGRDITDYAEEAHGIRLFEHSPSGKAGIDEQFDLLVIADGTRSTLRRAWCAHAGVQELAQPYPWGAYWAVLPDYAGEYTQSLRQWYRGAREMLGIMPTGFAPGTTQAVVSLFWSYPTALHAQAPLGLPELKRRVLKLNPGAAQVLDGWQAESQMAYAHYADVTLPRWHHGRAVVIGDAAHAMSPQLGMGTNLALVDAWTLATCLQQRAPSAGTGEVTAALTQYTQVRGAHIRYFQFASRWLTPLYQSNWDIAAWGRDWLMQPALAIPYVEQQMLNTLTGYKAGVFSGKLVL